MKNKNLYLIVGGLAFLVFIGYMSESGPHMIFGFAINIWIIRLLWLAFSVSNITKYIKIRNAEKETKNT